MTGSGTGPSRRQLVIRDAAGADPDAATVWAELLEERLRRMTHIQREWKPNRYGRWVADALMSAAHLKGMEVSRRSVPRSSRAHLRHQRREWISNSRLVVLSYS